MTVELAPFRRGRLLLVGALGIAVLAAFLWWSTGLWHGVAAAVVFGLSLVAMLLWAVPSDQVRSVELTENALVLRRASPTVTTLDRSDIVDARLVPGPPRTLEVTLGSANRVPRYQDVVNLGLADGNRIRMPLAAGADDELAALVSRLR